MGLAGGLDWGVILAGRDCVELCNLGTKKRPERSGRFGKIISDQVPGTGGGGGGCAIELAEARFATMSVRR